MKLGAPVMYQEIPNGLSFISPVAAVRKLNKLQSHVESLQSQVEELGAIASNLAKETRKRGKRIAELELQAERERKLKVDAKIAKLERELKELKSC